MVKLRSAGATVEIGSAVQCRAISGLSSCRAQVRGARKLLGNLRGNRDGNLPRQVKEPGDYGNAGADRRLVHDRPRGRAGLPQLRHGSRGAQSQTRLVGAGAGSRQRAVDDRRQPKPLAEPMLQLRELFSWFPSFVWIRRRFRPDRPARRFMAITQCLGKGRGDRREQAPKELLRLWLSGRDGKGNWPEGPER